MADRSSASSRIFCQSHASLLAIEPTEAVLLLSRANYQIARAETLRSRKLRIAALKAPGCSMFERCKALSIIANDEPGAAAWICCAMATVVAGSSFPTITKMGASIFFSFDVKLMRGIE